ncbi:MULTISPECIES: phage holin family protein [unclassified Microbacterium]|uniref:phage holin family protein n=1 Tax=unclassified Microbacterium TaxID=2609290 RepID=UPI001D4E262A|nr:phage holin family protein [Microbacterium sp. Bi121]CAH0137749.1 hypothetical protein SRABI121_00938 [Microbacterium sp. Bi121]
MITFLIRLFVFLASAAIGLIVADLVLPGFMIQWDRWWGFVICIVIFAILQSALSPLIARLADRYAPVLTGGIGIVSTLVALIVVVLLPIGGLRITDAAGWIVGAVIVWIVTALCTLLLPMIFLKRDAKERRKG